MKSIKKRLGKLYYKIRYLLTYSKRKSVKVSDAWQTVAYIKSTGCSLSRYGDGELDMVFNYLDGGAERKSGFQTYDAELGRRLCDILGGHDNPSVNHCVGLPGCMFGIGTSYLREEAAQFWEYYTYQNLDRALSCIDKNRTILETNFSRFYLSHRDKSRCREYIDELKTIWDNKNLLIVEGVNTRLGVSNDLFDNASSIKRILGPATDAWGRYEDILAEAVSACKELSAKGNLMVICALGMTATVLAYDLAKEGFQAIDLGHLDIEYEWMRMGATTKVAVSGKFTNESADGKNVKDIDNSDYKLQILKRIV